MARAGRLAGALLAETQGEFYLVGNTKQPCDFARAGFERPPEFDARTQPFVRLARSGPAELESPLLLLEVEGEALPRLLARTFLIERTGLVSERLWRLVIGASDEGDALPAAVTQARWLGEVPAAIWGVVREAVLRCT
jgi:hypothetical protein